MVTHVRYMLEVTAIVYADSETASGTQIRQLREQLSLAIRPGQRRRSQIRTKHPHGMGLKCENNRRPGYFSSLQNEPLHNASVPPMNSVKVADWLVVMQSEAKVGVGRHDLKKYGSSRMVDDRRL